VRGMKCEPPMPSVLTLSLPLHTSFGRQADISWLRLSRKQDRHSPRSERYRRLPPVSIYDLGFTIDERAGVAAQTGTSEHLVIRYS